MEGRRGKSIGFKADWVCSCVGLGGKGDLLVGVVVFVLCVVWWCVRVCVCPAGPQQPQQLVPAGYPLTSWVGLGLLGGWRDGKKEGRSRKIGKTKGQKDKAWEKTDGRTAEREEEGYMTWLGCLARLGGRKGKENLLQPNLDLSALPLYLRILSTYTSSRLLSCSLAFCSVV